MFTQPTPKRTQITFYFAEKIYAPNRYGWAAFERDRAYWRDVSWGKLTDCLTQGDKVYDYLSYFLLQAIPLEAGQYPYNFYEEVINCLKGHYAEQDIMTMAQLAGRDKQQQVYDMSQLARDIENRFPEADQVNIRKVMSGIIGVFPGMLSRIYMLCIMSYEQFIAAQKENFKQYIEPLAWPMVCYLLSQPNVSTYESHTNTPYDEVGKALDIRRMSNGVWFRVVPEHDSLPEDIRVQRKAQGERYYFAKLHPQQYEYEHERTSYTRLEHDIYAVTHESPRFPSKMFNIARPIIDSLGFVHIRDVQVPTDVREETINLDEAIDRATGLVDREVRERLQPRP
ncbi:MAG: hypothetical protein A3E83_03735 [Gammaproteobacteria bacterium RIFCSPHIGHO2_12_FULL_41_20]|nr:MAG: hypothetical protein A3E83_03735 [Gammaproteobacteria bacterium RIFCSPHIGHO2_12_FULL_41_20]